MCLLASLRANFYFICLSFFPSIFFYREHRGLQCKKNQNCSNFYIISLRLHKYEKYASMYRTKYRINDIRSCFFPSPPSALGTYWISSIRKRRAKHPHTEHKTPIFLPQSFLANQAMAGLAKHVGPSTPLCSVLLLSQEIWQGRRRGGVEKRRI